MAERITRRETLKRGLAAASVLAAVPEWATPALGQSETEVQFTDLPENFKPGKILTPGPAFSISGRSTGSSHQRTNSSQFSTSVARKWIRPLIV